MSAFINDIGNVIGDINRDPEEPEFIIDNDEEQELQEKEVVKSQKQPSKLRPWLMWLLSVIVVLLAVASVWWGYKKWNYYHKIGVPVSTLPKDNIEKLKQPAKQEAAEVVMTSDSILGVALDFYAIHGLRANIEFEEPDTADTSVFLYCRSADHKADGKYIGSLVVNGEEKQSDRSRLGYMGMVDDQMVIGISRFEDVKGYCKKKGGSFFRQFMLVSDGEIPHSFSLHGKVERRAIGRMDNTLYYIATRNKETLWDFADAIREYGFIDAIYITGGYDYGYCRTADGERHDIGNIEDYPHKKGKGVIPWLVFRRRTNV